MHIVFPTWVRRVKELHSLSPLLPQTHAFVCIPWLSTLSCAFPGYPHFHVHPLAIHTFMCIPWLSTLSCESPGYPHFHVHPLAIHAPALARSTAVRTTPYRPSPPPPTRFSDTMRGVENHGAHNPIPLLTSPSRPACLQVFQTPCAGWRTAMRATPSPASHAPATCPRRASTPRTARGIGCAHSVSGGG